MLFNGSLAEPVVAVGLAPISRFHFPLAFRFLFTASSRVPFPTESMAHSFRARPPSGYGSIRAFGRWFRLFSQLATLETGFVMVWPTKAMQEKWGFAQLS